MKAAALEAAASREARLNSVPKKLLSSLFLMTSLALVGCGGDDAGGDGNGANRQNPEGQTPGEGDCSCSVRHNGVSEVLACGTTACVNGMKYGCDAEAGATPAGDCSDGSGSTGGASGGSSGGSTSGGSTGGGSTGGGGTGGGTKPDPVTPRADWTRLESGTTANLHALSIPIDGAGTFAPPQQLYVVGEDGFCAMSRLGAQFRITDCGLGAEASSFDFFGVSADSSGDTVIVGSGGAIFVRDHSPVPGQAIQIRRIPNPETNTLRAVTSNANDVYLLGDAGLARRMLSDRRLATLTGHPSSTSFRGVTTDLIGSNWEVWGVGTNGTIVHYVESSSSLQMSVETSGVSTRLNAVTSVTVSREREILAVGDRGTILSRDSSGLWTRQDSGVTVDLFGVEEGIFGAYAVGANGTILFRRNGTTTWTKQDSGVTTTLRAVERVQSTSLGAASEVFVVGDGGTLLVREDARQ